MTATVPLGQCGDPLSVILEWLAGDDPIESIAAARAVAKAADVGSCGNIPGEKKLGIAIARLHWFDYHSVACPRQGHKDIMRRKYDGLDDPHPGRDLHRS